MPTASPSTAPDMTSDATFRVWGKSIGDTIASLGWARTSDAGQINWTTLTKPSAANAAAGYELFKMTDALSGSYPVYLKIEYGSAPYSSGYPGVWITVGTGADGAGNLTGQISTRTQLGCGGASTLSYISRFSGAPNRLSAALWSSASGGTYLTFFNIEREKNADGTDGNTGVMIHLAGYNAGKVSQVLRFSGALAQCAQWNLTSTPAATSAAVGSDVYCYPVRAWAPGETSPVLGIVGYFGVDLASGNPLTIQTWEGGSRAYFPLGTSYLGSIGYGNSGYMSAAMRWD